MIKNNSTGNITPVSGAVEENETLKSAAIRELREEVSWDINEDQLVEIPVRHEFVYAANKKERAGDEGCNQVFLLNTDTLAEPLETKDAKAPQWLEAKEVVEQISFDDLKDVVKKSITYIDNKLSN